MKVPTHLQVSHDSLMAYTAKRLERDEKLAALIKENPILAASLVLEDWMAAQVAIAEAITKNTHIVRGLS